MAPPNRLLPDCRAAEPACEQTMPPVSCLRIPAARRLRNAVPLGLLAVALTLGGCAGGDFGRTRASARSDDMHRWIGEEATASIGVGSSQFQLTDDERQLRDYAYPLIEPPHSRPEWKNVFGDYQPLPAPWRREIQF